ncbi:tyrosine-protein phosphatase [Pendulispora albinea]|uniref:Tyrosine-protein phosphatase n=1 Tax=Pendulispora albinea TaxID=2741071 RepID=A0ABZ2M5S3_9BACT
MVRRFSKFSRFAANALVPLVSLASLGSLVSATNGCSNTTNAPASAPAPLVSVQAEKDAQGNYTLSWDPVAADATVEVTAGTSPDAIDHGRVLARAAASARKVTVSGLDAGKRWYFEVGPSGGASTVVGERHVRLTGASNYRDLGGYIAADGRAVRWGAAFRSDHLGKIDARDVDYLTGMGVKLAFDFRTDKEVQKSPDTIADGARIAYERGAIVLPIDPKAILESGTVIDEPFLTKVYTDIIDTNAAVFAKLFRQLGETGTRSMVFHCTGGKDRAGIASALLLAFLGVSDDTITRDYALSDTYNAQSVKAQEDAMRAQGQDPAKLGVALKSPPGVVQGMLDHVRSKYGSVDAYLKSGGLDDLALAKVRAALLTEAHPTR